MKSPISRRRFLSGTISAGGAALIAACAPAAAPPGVTAKPAAAPTNTPAPAAAAATKPAAPAPTNTSAAAAAATKPAAPAPTNTPAPVAPAKGGATPTPTAVPVREAAAGRRFILEVQHPHAGVGLEPQNQLFAEFEKHNPEIGIKGVWAANDLSTNQKLYTAVAAGTPPNVSWVDGPQVAEWAARGVLSDLTDRFKNDKLTQEDFWTPSWRQNIWRGKIHAMTVTSDANFGFFWNKAVFQDAGLDPEKPPTTIAEMDEMHQRITKVEGNNVVRMGLIPWTVYGSANSIFTWGWAFGGSFYDDKNEKITANSDLVVKTLDWMVENYAKKHDITRIAGFMAGFGTGENHPFFVGKTAMAPFGPWELGNLARFAPNLKYGITFLPAGPPPAQPKSSWVGGWCVGLPQGAKLSDQGWQFIKWIGASPEGAKAQGTIRSNLSGYKKNPYLETAAKNKDLAAFIEILKEARHQRPVQPAQGFFMGALARAVDDAIFQKKTSKVALQIATEETQRELDKLLKK